MARDVLRRYGVATAFVLGAAGLRLALRGWLGSDLPFLVQFVAVIAAAAFGGMGPGLLATVLGSTVTYFLFLRDDLAVQTGHLHGAATALRTPELRRFLLEGCLISILGALLRQARLRAVAADIASAALEKQMVEIGDQERRRFGHDLHDGLGQQLTGIALLSESLAHRLSTQNVGAAAEQAATITNLVSETIGWTRDIARGLSPLTLEIDGLPTALDDLGASAVKLFRVRCTVECVDQTLPLPEASAVHVYRIMQEAVSNSVKHGKAKNVSIRAIIEGDSMIFTVEDDGSGLSAKTVAEPGIGLRIMQYRANLIGARLSVARRSAQGGTTVSCILPLPVPMNEARRFADAIHGDEPTVRRTKG